MSDTPPRNDFATVAVVLALAALICNLISPRLCIGLGAAALVMAAMGVRHGVRTDQGMARALTGAAFGLVAVAIGAIVLGGQKGAQYSGLPAPEPLYRVVSTA